MADSGAESGDRSHLAWIGLDQSLRLRRHCRWETITLNVQRPELCHKPLQRNFSQFNVSLTAQLLRATLNDDKEKYTKMMEMRRSTESRI